MDTHEKNQSPESWYAPKEIAKMPGMPKTVQGVHKRAKRERWVFRKRTGVRGPAIEYNLTERFPPLETKTAQNLKNPLKARHEEMSDSLELVWCTAFRQCTENEKKALIKQLIRYGMSSFLLRQLDQWIALTQWFDSLPKTSVQEFFKIFSSNYAASCEDLSELNS